MKNKLSLNIKAHKQNLSQKVAMVLKTSLIGILLMFFVGCKTGTVYVKQQIPAYLLECQSVEYERDMKTNEDFALFVIELDEAYSSCKIKLEIIKNLVGE